MPTLFFSCANNRQFEEGRSVRCSSITTHPSLHRWLTFTQTPLWVSKCIRKIPPVLSQVDWKCEQYSHVDAVSATNLFRISRIFLKSVLLRIVELACSYKTVSKRHNWNFTKKSQTLEIIHENLSSIDNWNVHSCCNLSSANLSSSLRIKNCLFTTK